MYGGVGYGRDFGLRYPTLTQTQVITICIHLFLNIELKLI